jgi:hypothetical protein
MNSNPHRNNSDFQLRHFLAGSCFTPDGAWMLMYGQMIDREATVKVCEASRLKQLAKRMDIEEVLNDPNAKETDKLRAQADLLEQEAHAETFERNLQAAKMELATITNIMEELEPHRKYKHLPLLEANEAAQRDEWLGEFKNRVENFLFSTGTIPEDHLRAMRNHPDFQGELLPHIVGTMKKIESQRNSIELLTNHSVPFLENKNNVG